MKLKFRALTLLLTVAMLLSFMPALTFADDEREVLYPNVSGSCTTVDGSPLEGHIQEDNGRQWFFWYNLEEEGNKITITHDGITEVLTYSGDKGGFAASDGRLFRNWYSELSSDEKSANAEFYLINPDNENGSLAFILKLPVRIPQSISFSPQSIDLYADDIVSWDEDNNPYLSLTGSVSPAYEGSTYSSPFPEDSTITVNYNDGTTKVYKHVFYLTEDEEYSGYDYGFSYNGGTPFYAECTPNELQPGKNTITVDFCEYGLSTTFTANVIGGSAPKPQPQPQPQPSGSVSEAAQAAASNINKKTVSAADIKNASDLGATSVTLGSSVKKIQKNAFTGTNITTIVVQSKKLKAKSVKGSLKGSSVTTVKVKIGNKKVNKKYIKKYKKIFTKKNAGKKAKVK